MKVNFSIEIFFCFDSYMYAVSMARNIDHQIENKGTATLDVTSCCGTIWDLRTAFSNMRDLSLPGKPHPLLSGQLQCQFSRSILCSFVLTINLKIVIFSRNFKKICNFVILSVFSKKK